MDKLAIPYNTIKEILTNYNVPIYYSYNDDNTYDLFSASKDFIYTCNITSSANILDFEENIKTNSVEVTGGENVAITLATIPYRWAYSGYKVVQKSLYIDGKTLTITPGSSGGYIEWQYASLVELQGLDAQVCGDGAQFGDYLNLTIEHPIVGEVNRFGNNVFMFENNIYGAIADVVADLAAGLKIRLSYYACDTNGRNILARVRCFR